MIEFLHTCQELVIGLTAIVWGLLTVVLTFCWDMLHNLHVGHPRLEGLLIGVALTWLMLRRDKHPVLRVLSAPLKLVLDILDLVWGQVVEVVSDASDAVWGCVTGTYGWCKAKVSGAANWVMNLLGKLKEKLTK